MGVMHIRAENPVFIINPERVLAQKFWGEGSIVPSAPSSPSPFSPFSETEKIRTSYRPTGYI